MFGKNRGKSRPLLQGCDLTAWKQAFGCPSLVWRNNFPKVNELNLMGSVGKMLHYLSSYLLSHGNTSWNQGVSEFTPFWKSHLLIPEESDEYLRSKEPSGLSYGLAALGAVGAGHQVGQQALKLEPCTCPAEDWDQHRGKAAVPSFLFQQEALW